MDNLLFIFHCIKIQNNNNNNNNNNKINYLNIVSKQLEIKINKLFNFRIM